MAPKKDQKLTYDQEAELQFQKKKEAEYNAMSPQQKKVLQLFNDYDTDRNEKISKVEFRQILVACGMPRDKVDALFSSADTNHDGVLSVKEMMFWILGNAKGGGTAGREIKDHMNRPSDPQEAISLFLDFCKDLCRGAVGVVTKPDEPGIVGKVFFKDIEKAAFEKRKKCKVQVREMTTSESDMYLALDSLFENFDVNGNQYVSMNELVTGLQSYRFNCHKSVIEKMFRLLDGAEIRGKELTIGPTTRETTDADAGRIAEGKIKYTTLTTKMKAGALDRVEFMAHFGRALSEDEAWMTDEVKTSVERRGAAAPSK